MAAPSLLTSIPAAPKPAKKKKKAFKVGKFDKDAVRLVQSGTVSLSGISRALGVDAGQALARLELLSEKGYLVRDAGAPDVFRLGVEGYNKYAKPLKAKEKERPLEKPERQGTKIPAELETSNPKESPVQEKASWGHAGKTQNQPPVQETLGQNLGSGNQRQPLVLQQSLAKQNPDPSSLVPLQPSIPADDVPVARNSVDLGDLLRKGAPGGRFAQDGMVGAGEQAVISNGNGAQREICELCRAGFSVSVKEQGLSKYAHCSCGAAYHKDCHDSLTGNGGRCARCGRKIAAMLDRRSEEALSSVKDAFE